MKRLLALSFTLQFILIVSGQDRESRLRRLAFAKEDINKVWLYDSVGFNYAWSDADSGIKYGQQGLDLAQKLHLMEALRIRS